MHLAAGSGVAGVGGGPFGAPSLSGESDSSGHSMSVRPSWLADEYSVALDAALDA